MVIKLNIRNLRINKYRIVHTAEYCEWFTNDIPTAACLGVRCYPARNVASTPQWSRLVETRNWILDTTISTRNRTPKCLRDLVPCSDRLKRFPLFRHWMMKPVICTSCTTTLLISCSTALFPPTLDPPGRLHWPNFGQSRCGMLLLIQPIGPEHEWRKNGHLLAMTTPLLGEACCTPKWYSSLDIHVCSSLRDHRIVHSHLIYYRSQSHTSTSNFCLTLHTMIGLMVTARFCIFADFPQFKSFVYSVSRLSQLPLKFFLYTFDWLPVAISLPVVYSMSVIFVK